MIKQLKEPRTFRVFFSSPFKGLEEERAELTRKYIPEIQHKCAEMGLQFVAVDMRWGISVESAQAAQTITICLKEIDRSDMFVGFFGQRYGWQGHTDQLLQENINTALGKYPWLENYRDRSVTELEVLHGFLNNPGEMPAVFCFRDKKYDNLMKDMLKDKAVGYTPENEFVSLKLSELKKRIVALQSKALAVHEDYPNPFEGARLIYESILKYLNDNVLKNSEAMSRREKDLAPHKAFAVSRTSLYVENQEHCDFLNDALKSGMHTRADSTEHKEDKDQQLPYVVVTGPSGCGKSSLLCNWLHSHVTRLPNTITIPYYIGCAPSTRDPEGLLDFVYGELEYYLAEGNKLKEAAAEDQSVKSGEMSSYHPSDQQAPRSSTASAQTDTKHTDPNTLSTNTSTASTQLHEKGAHSGGNSPDSSATSVGPQDASLVPSNPVSEQQQHSTNITESDKKDVKSNGDGDSTHKAIGKGTDESSAKKDKNDSDEDMDKAKSKEESRPKGKELQHQVVKKLEQLVVQGNTVVLVFDAINRLVQANKTSKVLYWLPENLCKGVVCIVSTEETDQISLSVLVKRNFCVVKMAPLLKAAQKEICEQTLKQSGKELSPAQLERVVNAKQTENPLFLKIVLAELSVFGYFRKLDEKIDSLIQQSSVKELLQNCLERLEADYNDSTYEGNLVGEIMKAIYVAHQGLTESEICSIFRIPSSTWSPLYFAMEYFLMSHLGNLGFAFLEIREAVKERYLQGPNAESMARRRLINYFDGIRKRLAPWVTHKKLSEKPVDHAVVELVWLLHYEGDREALVTTLTHLPVLRIMNHGYDLELLELWKWTGLRWSEICNRLLKALDIAIADCYVDTEEGILDSEESPGVRMRASVAHMRDFIDLVNFSHGLEKILEREIRILENAQGKMDEAKRKELLRDAYYHLACTYASQDRNQEARALHETNLAELEKALEEKEDEEIRKQIAFTQNGLGIVCMRVMEYDQSIKYFTKSIEFHNKKKDWKNEASSYTNLALSYMYLKEHKKALQYNTKVLELYEEGLFGQLSIEVGNVYTNIGLMYRRMGDLDKAEEAYLKSLEIKANAVGWDHLVVATAFMNLGTLEMHRSNYTKAEEWTRKAIGVYEANEQPQTNKDHRRCRENLFANILRQGKYEEVLTFFIELFDILHQNAWLDECLSGMHRRMVVYMIENRPDMLDKAEEISMALIDSSKGHPDNYCHLVAIDAKRGFPDTAVHPPRPHKYSLQAGIEKFPSWVMKSDMLELNMKYYLLPKDDKEGIKRLMMTQVVPNVSERDLKSLMLKISTVAQKMGKTELCIQSLKAALEQEPSNLKLGQLFLCLCVHLGQADEAVPFISTFLNHYLDENTHFQASRVSPAQTRMDLAKVLLTKGDVAHARDLLLLLTAISSDNELKEEARALLEGLPESEEENFKANIASAARNRH